MDLFDSSERMMQMSDAVWQRHANPWSVWSRFTCLPLLILAIWSRVWIGWAAMIPVALALFWIWWNPRAFPRPRDFGSWASRAVLGEQVFLARKRLDVPRHHVTAAHSLAALSALGLFPLAWGLFALDLWAVLAGCALLVLPKVWFCDRMVWLHADLTGSAPGTAMPSPLMPQERSAAP